MGHAFASCARTVWRPWLVPCLLASALAACGGGDTAANAVNSIGINGLIQPEPPAASTFELVILEAVPPVAAGATASAASINATGQVAFTSSRADGRHALWYDGQTIQDLGPGYAAAANNAGQVAGGTDTTAGSPAHALRWTTARQTAAVAVDLGAPANGTSQAEAINARGQVAGSASQMVDGRLQSRPFVWTEGVGRINPGMPEVPAFTPGGFAASLNARGQMAGTFNNQSESVHAYFWPPDGSFLDIGTLGGPFSAARGLNDESQVAGIAQIESARLFARSHAFLWSVAGGMRDLGTLGGRNSDALAINGSGQVAGASDTVEIDPFTFANPRTHAFYWSPSGPAAGRMLDLGTFGGLTSSAFALNDSGQVVGKAATDPAHPNLSHAFVWTAAGGLVDLNTRVPDAPAGLTLTEAIAISQNGSILARTFGGLVLLEPAGNGFADAQLSMDSPPGAYREHPGLTGRARFSAGIRSGGAGQQPAGQTRFDLPQAGLRFESTVYDWLNVQASRAQYQGSGTLNGLGGYQFKVTLIDGAKDSADDAENDKPHGRASHAEGTQDRLRIRIWHADAVRGVTVVDYDNQLDAGTEGTANEGTARKSGRLAVQIQQSGKAQARHAGLLK
ncbi:MAG: hypothetical protein JWR74_1218 [Polaromonas sp.]|nr:hypothetical protein [Polaromonas sp.]